MVEYTDPDLGDTERAALHDLQLGIEKLYRGYGALLEWHHHVGSAMDYFDDAEQRLREAGHTEFADEVRDVHLPAGAVGDAWTYELVDSFREGFLADATAFEASVRDSLADGTPHVSERRRQGKWRERSEREDWPSE